MTNFRVVNLIIVYDPTEKQVLMCLRQKNPYKGLYNFVGGKKEAGETDFESAYRELEEETGIGSDDIELKRLFVTRYDIDAIELQVYFGTLKQMVELVAEKNPLFWLPLADYDFSDDSRFAGQGNIKHMLDIIHESKQIFD